jgi:hypothetical protein
MKFKNLTTILILLTLVYQTAHSQDNYLKYKILNNNNDSIEFKSKLLSDKKIQMKFESDYIKKKSKDFNAIIIKDNLNRKFEKIVYKDTSLFLRVLVEGHNNLYSTSLNNYTKYILISPNDTIEMVKNDISEYTYLKEDRKYINQLSSLAKDFPESAINVKDVHFNNSSFQSYIYNLNKNYPDKENTKIDFNPLNRGYLHIGAMIDLMPTDKNYVFSVMTSIYRLGFSKNISIRAGLSANYSEHKFTYTENYSSVKCILKNKYIQLPFLINFEFTTWFLTPYFYMGIAPFVDYYEDTEITKSSTQTDSDTWYFFNLMEGIGMKAKLTNNLNVMTEYRSDFLCWESLVFGIEYVFDLNKRN